VFFASSLKRRFHLFVAISSRVTAHKHCISAASMKASHSGQSIGCLALIALRMFLKADQLSSLLNKADLLKGELFHRDERPPCRISDPCFHRLHR